MRDGRGLIDMPYFNVILDVDFLSRYGTEIDYRKKKGWFHLDDGEEFTFGEGQLSMMISNIKARKTLSKECMSYLTHIVNKLDKLVSSLWNTLVMYEYQVCFLIIYQG